MEFFATCGSGLEAVLGEELRGLGVHGVRPLKGGVSFAGELRDAYTALLWSRIASRVLLTLARVDAHDADALYEGAHGLAWHEHIGTGATLAVAAHGSNDELRDTRFTSLKVKDAICDALRERTGVRPDVDAHAPDVRVNVRISRERATLSIDLSGEALDRRGYRPAGKPVGAPARENLAAALLMLAGWSGQGGQALLDPLCGSGVLAVEAAMIAADIAPGIARASWGFQGWSGHDEALWGELLAAADARCEEAQHAEARVFAADADAACRAYAQVCARRAAVSERIVFASSHDELSALCPAALDERLLCCIMPTAQQLAPSQLPSVLCGFETACGGGPGLRALALLVQEQALAIAPLGAPSRSVAVKNGPHDSAIAIYERGGSDALGAQVAVRDKHIAVASDTAQQFASRLNKVVKQRRKWAAEAGVSAYRVYDADLPDYKFAIDLYEGAGRDEGTTKVHVAEYAAPKDIDPAKASRRVGDALRIIPAVLEVPLADVYVKRRVRSKGGSQYELGVDYEKRQCFTVAENGLRFEVDLADYLDTGLFLDHRDTRRAIGTIAHGKSFLNLFAYTGTASVYAAAGGATFTTSVDLSNTYQRWARRNFKLNKLLDDNQRFERADVLSWVQDKRHSKERWDVVFADVPTFSNSAKMGARSWDVQRDHAEFLIDASRLLTRGGALLFSCNKRGFKPDVATLAKAGVAIADITAKTIPADFERTPRVHRCYLLKRV